MILGYCMLSEVRKCLVEGCGWIEVVGMVWWSGTGAVDAVDAANQGFDRSMPFNECGGQLGPCEGNERLFCQRTTLN